MWSGSGFSILIYQFICLYFFWYQTVQLLQFCSLQRVLISVIEQVFQPCSSSGLPWYYFWSFAFSLSFFLQKLIGILIGNALNILYLGRTVFFIESFRHEHGVSPFIQAFLNFINYMLQFSEQRSCKYFIDFNLDVWYFWGAM